MMFLEHVTENVHPHMMSALTTLFGDVDDSYWIIILFANCFDTFTVEKLKSQLTRLFLSVGPSFEN